MSRLEVWRKRRVVERSLQTSADPSTLFERSCTAVKPHGVTREVYLQATQSRRVCHGCESTECPEVRQRVFQRVRGCQYPDQSAGLHSISTCGRAEKVPGEVPARASDVADLRWRCLITSQRRLAQVALRADLSSSPLARADESSICTW